MSTTKFTRSVISPESVLCRAFGGEPIKLTAVAAGQGAVEVFGSDPEKMSGWPAEDVFEFDAELLANLRRAYEKEDRKKLSALWSRATAKRFRAAG